MQLRSKPHPQHASGANCQTKKERSHTKSSGRAAGARKGPFGMASMLEEVLQIPRGILPGWFVAIILAIFSYLSVLYYITYPKLVR